MDEFESAYATYKICLWLRLPTCFHWVMKGCFLFLHFKNYFFLPKYTSFINIARLLGRFAGLLPAGLQRFLAIDTVFRCFEQRQRQPQVVPTNEAYMPGAGGWGARGPGARMQGADLRVEFVWNWRGRKQNREAWSIAAMRQGPGAPLPSARTSSQLHLWAGAAGAFDRASRGG